MIRIATETTAVVEKRGTLVAASSQRRERVRRRPITRNASPPVQTAAACTCAASAMTEPTPTTLAWPESPGVNTTPAARASKTGTVQGVARLGSGRPALTTVALETAVALDAAPAGTTAPPSPPPAGPLVPPAGPLVALPACPNLVGPS